MNTGASEEGLSKRTTDVFDVGIYLMEAAVVAAILYAIVSFPAWLRPVT